MSGARRRALFVFSIPHHFREMEPVAAYVQAQGWEVHALIGYSGARGEEAAHGCAAAGFTVHHVPEALKYGRHFEVTDAQGEVHRPAVAAPRAAGLLPAMRRRAGAMVATLRRNQQIVRFASALLQRVAPEVVFGGFFHSCGEFHNGIAARARRAGVLFCCLPMSPYVGERVAAGYRFENLTEAMHAQLSATTSGWRRLVALARPRWVRARNGTRIFMFEPTRMVAAQAFGLIDGNPWQSPSERYDVVFVESEFSRRLLLDSGDDAGRIVVSGKPLLDAVFRGLADPSYAPAVYGDVGLTPGEAFVLVNIEPGAEHAYTTWETHWARFRGLMAVVQKIGLPVVLSLHPLCHPKNYLFAESEFGVTVSLRRKIAELYPYATLAVSFPCSTNHLAGVFGTPLVVYDWFRVTEGPRQDLFRLPGARFAYTPEELRGLIEETLSTLATGDRPAAGPAAPRPACEIVLETVEHRLRRSA